MRFEAGLTRLAEGLSKPRGQKQLATFQHRVAIGACSILPLLSGSLFSSLRSGWSKEPGCHDRNTDGSLAAKA